MKYLNLEGLSHFLEKLLSKFTTKEELRSLQDNVITNNEIDAICGANSTYDISAKTLVDIVTGTTYKVYVENGNLSMMEANESSDVQTTKFVFVDISTDTVYDVYVENGKLHMMEVE